MQSLEKIKSLRNGEITLFFVDLAKSCTSHKFLTPQICLLTLFTKIKFSRKFWNLKYWKPVNRYVDRKEYDDVSLEIQEPEYPLHYNTYKMVYMPSEVKPT